jgi:AcrR family transcriptional regulator
MYDESMVSKQPNDANAIADAVAALTRAIADSAKGASVDAKVELATQLASATTKIQASLGTAAETLVRSANKTAANGRAAKAENTRRDLISAARRVFAARGYEGASVAELAKEAGYTKGALYANFATKEDLFIAALLDVAKESDHTDTGELVQPQPSKMNVEEILIGMEAYLYVFRHPGKRPDLEQICQESLGYIANHVHNLRPGHAEGAPAYLPPGAPSKGDWYLAYGFWALPSMAAVVSPGLGDTFDIDEAVAWLSAILENVDETDPMFSQEGPRAWVGNAGTDEALG